MLDLHNFCFSSIYEYIEQLIAEKIQKRKKIYIGHP